MRYSFQMLLAGCSGLLSIAFAVPVGAEVARTVECKDAATACTVTIAAARIGTININRRQPRATATIEDVVDGTIAAALPSSTTIDTVKEGTITLTVVDGDVEITAPADAGKPTVVATFKTGKVAIAASAGGVISIESATYEPVGFRRYGTRTWPRPGADVCNAAAYFRRECELIELKICWNGAGTPSLVGMNENCSAGLNTGRTYRPYARSFCYAKVTLDALCGSFDPYPGELRQATVRYRCTGDDKAASAREARATDGAYVYLDCHAPHRHGSAAAADGWLPAVGSGKK